MLYAERTAKRKKSMMREESLGTNSKRRNKNPIFVVSCRAEPEPSFPEVLFSNAEKEKDVSFCGPSVMQGGCGKFLVSKNKRCRDGVDTGVSKKQLSLEKEK